jgi:hypothetical protein
MESLAAVLVAVVMALGFCYKIKPYEYKPEQFIGPNGKKYYRIECYYKDYVCTNRASEMCPTGYDILDSSVTDVPLYKRSGSTLDEFSGIAERYDLVVACKDNSIHEIKEPSIK